MPYEPKITDSRDRRYRRVLSQTPHAIYLRKLRDEREAQKACKGCGRRRVGGKKTCVVCVDRGALYSFRTHARTFLPAELAEEVLAATEPLLPSRQKNRPSQERTDASAARVFFLGEQATSHATKKAARKRK